MTFSIPTLFKDALAFLREKVLVPTGLSSAELRGVESNVKRRSIFSARVTQVRVLQTLKDAVERMLSGEANLAEGKLELQQVLASTGYTPQGGFPQDAPGTVPPARPGSLRDLSSERRRRLQLDTNYLLAANESYATAHNSEETRFAFPAWELVRIEGRFTPRGFRRRGGDLQVDPGQDWPTRFQAAGGELWDQETRMIARKDSEVWLALGEGAGGYEDTLGNPFPPFAFGSGYGWRAVPREECLELGVINEDDEIAAAKAAVARGRLEVPAQGVDDDTLKWFADLEKKRAQGDAEARLKPSERLERAARSTRGLVRSAANVKDGLRWLMQVLDTKEAGA